MKASSICSPYGLQLCGGAIALGVVQWMRGSSGAKMEDSHAALRTKGV